jgi:hypothetical protein
MNTDVCGYVWRRASPADSPPLHNGDRMNRFGLTLAAVAVLVFQGCAFVPQKATLAPSLNVAASNEGRNVEIGVRVVDERTSKSLGRRGTAFGAAAEISSDQDVAALVQQQVTEGLQKKGFKVAAFGANAGPQLTVEIRLPNTPRRRVSSPAASRSRELSRPSPVAPRRPTRSCIAPTRKSASSWCPLLAPTRSRSARSSRRCSRS